MTETKTIKRSLIDPSRTNPRKRFNSEKLQELAQSLRKHGLQTELWVRAKPDGRFELIAGERRWRAAEFAEIVALPCKVYSGLSDSEVIELQLIENLDREDLTAVEEAESFRGLMDQGYSVEKLMDKFSRSRAHIFSRLKLLKLEGPVREALENETIPPTIADLLSQVPASYQEKALNDICARGEVMSFRQARDYLNHNYTADLGAVNWNMEDRKLLPEAGDCGSCPKRAGNCLETFPELKKKPNTCTDLDCFNRKKTAYRHRLLNEEAKRGKVLTLDQCNEVFEEWGYLSNDSEWTDLDGFGVHTGRDYVRASDQLKKPKSDCFAAVTPRGEVRRLYRKEDLRAELAALGFVEKRNAEVQEESPEDRAKRLAKERLEADIDKETGQRVAKVISAALAKAGPVAKGERVLWLLALSGTCVKDSVAKRYEVNRNDFYSTRNALAFVDSVKKWSDEQLRTFVVENALSENWREGFVPAREELACELLKIDAKAIRKEVRKELTGKAKETLVHKIATKPQEPSLFIDPPELKGVFQTGTEPEAEKAASKGKSSRDEARLKRIREAARERWAKAKVTRAAA